MMSWLTRYKGNRNTLALWLLRLVLLWQRRYYLLLLMDSKE